MIRSFLLLLLGAVSSFHAHRAHADQPFELTDGDRVLFIGSTLIERAQRFDYLETRFTTLFPETNLLFRNLGWSGDTVFGDSRAGFDTAAEGYTRLIDQVRGLEPTVVIVGYGTNEAFAGPSGLPRFIDGTLRLWDDLDSTGARIVILSPTRQENLGHPLPNPSTYNRHAQLYGETLRVLARRRGYRFVDLFQINSPSHDAPWTYNGQHYDAYGYWRWTDALTDALGHKPTDWLVDLDAASATYDVQGTTLEQLSTSPAAVRFTTHDIQLPATPPPTDRHTPSNDQWSRRQLRIRNLPAGQYTLSIDDQPVINAPHDQWSAGVWLTQGPEFDQVEALRQTILKKNELYFHRWRPQNETYLFGFRKHEQGNNAVEIPQFDPLVAEQESHLAQQRRPVPHVYELLRESEVTP